MLLLTRQQPVYKYENWKKKLASWELVAQRRVGTWKSLMHSIIANDMAKTMPFAD